MEKYKLYINGEWKASSTAKYFKSIDPSTELEWAQFSEANADDVDYAVKSAHTAFKGEWSKLLANQRGSFLRKIGGKIKITGRKIIINESNIPKKKLIIKLFLIESKLELT